MMSKSFKIRDRLYQGFILLISLTIIWLGGGHGRDRVSPRPLLVPLKLGIQIFSSFFDAFSFYPSSMY